jgi:hypothetical protein
VLPGRRKWHKAGREAPQTDFTRGEHPFESLRRAINSYKRVKKTEVNKLTHSASEASGSHSGGCGCPQAYNTRLSVEYAKQGSRTMQVAESCG